MTVPHLKSNLLSVLHLSRHRGVDMLLRQSTMLFQRDSIPLYAASVNERNVPILAGRTIHTNSTIPLSAFIASASTLSLQRLHERIGHRNIPAISRALSRGSITGVTIDSSDPPPALCVPCIAGKQHRCDDPAT